MHSDNTYARVPPTPVFRIEHSLPTLNERLLIIELMRKAHSKMQITRYRGFKNTNHSTNQFNNSEYKRWSKGTKGNQCHRTEWGIESFLGTNENLQSGRQDVSNPLVEVGSTRSNLCNALYESDAMFSEHQRMSHDGIGADEKHQVATGLGQSEHRRA